MVQTVPPFFLKKANKSGVLKKIVFLPPILKPTNYVRNFRKSTINYCGKT